MAKLARATIQKLAVLRALGLWNQGVYGPVRLHKTLFFADKLNKPGCRLFTFKKYYLGQYSHEIAEALNVLRTAGKLLCRFDGPAERIAAKESNQSLKKIKLLFANYYPEWDKELMKAFHDWGYLTNDQILVKAHDDPSYTESEFGKVIFKTGLKNEVDLPALAADTAEQLTDLVDGELAVQLRNRLIRAFKRPAKTVDWRTRYFG